MNTLEYGFHLLLKHNKDGSHATQSDRRNHLKLMAVQLKELGYRNLKVKSLRTKHINALLKFWKTQRSDTVKRPITDATIKNRVATLRWVAEKIAKQNIVPRTNAELGLERRTLDPTNRAWSLLPSTLDQLPAHLRLSLQMQQEFGLRREEAAKITMSIADKTDKLFIQSSWAKGGKEREIPIRTHEQRQLVNQVKALVNNKSLIPPHMSYKQYLNWHTANMAKFDIKNGHGLRHYYAQRLYYSLTGKQPPKSGGHKPKMTDEIKTDRQARKIISQELGHYRTSVTRVYLG